MKLNNGDWGLGIGDWGLGIGPNPQSPIPNPQSPIPIKNFFIKTLKFENKIFIIYFLIIFYIYLIKNKDAKFKRRICRFIHSKKM